MRRREVFRADVRRYYDGTVTTWAPRDGEIDGIDYHFPTATLHQDLGDHGFLEANEVDGTCYGSPRDQVREALLAVKDVDPQDRCPGREVVKEQVPEALLIFAIPLRIDARAAPSARDRDRRRAGAAPAGCGDRAGAPGRLRPRRERHGWSTGRPRRSTDYRPGAAPTLTGAPRVAGDLGLDPVRQACRIGGGGRGQSAAAGRSWPYRPRPALAGLGTRSRLAPAAGTSRTVRGLAPFGVRPARSPDPGHASGGRRTSRRNPMVAWTGSEPTAHCPPR